MLPYPQVESVRPFEPTPSVLDLDRIRETWGPWTTLEESASAHPMARNAYVNWRLTRANAANDLLSRPWTQLHAAGGLRTLVLAQARQADPLGADDEFGSAAVREFRNQWEPLLRSGTAIERLRVVATLNSLTMTSPLLELPPPDFSAADPVSQHLSMEWAKALLVRDPDDKWGRRCLDHLSEHAGDVYVRLLAGTCLLNHTMRSPSTDLRAARLLERCEVSWRASESGEPWLHQLMSCHFLRLKAFHCTLDRDLDGVWRLLEQAREREVAAERFQSDSPVIAHLIQECRSRRRGAAVRAAKVERNRERVADEIREIGDEERNHPEHQLVCGNLFAATGEPEAAVRYYLDAAEAGSMHGALGAFNAYRILSELRDAERAEHALALLHDLDPDADLDGIRRAE